MTYQDREEYRALVDGIADLRERLGETHPESSLSRGEALELLDLLEKAAERTSPERLDRLMDNIADEAARRAGALALARGV
jgi:hypothetical protein